MVLTRSGTNFEMTRTEKSDNSPPKNIPSNYQCLATGYTLLKKPRIRAPLMMKSRKIPIGNRVARPKAPLVSIPEPPELFKLRKQSYEARYASVS